MKKSVVTTFIFLAISATTFAQFQHSLGVNFTVVNGNITSKSSSGNDYSDKVSFAQSLVQYFMRYNLVEKDNSSISIGMPLGLGVGIARNTSNSDAGVAFGFDVPLVIDYNIGHKSTADNDKGFGCFFGAGFGYSYTGIRLSTYTSNVTSIGPIFRTGFRISVKDESISIPLSFKLGTGNNQVNTYGLGVIWDF